MNFANVSSSGCATFELYLVVLHLLNQFFQIHARCGVSPEPGADWKPRRLSAPRVRTTSGSSSLSGSPAGAVKDIRLVRVCPYLVSRPLASSTDGAHGTHSCCCTSRVTEDEMGWYTGSRAASATLYTSGRQEDQCRRG